jgi:hypothetical protein
MKRTIRLGGYVVSLMLGALALGCGGDDKQARSPAGEPFESSVAEPRSTYSSSEAGAQSGMSGTTGQSGTTGSTGTTGTGTSDMGATGSTDTTGTGATGTTTGMGDTGTTGMSGSTSTTGTGQDLCSMIERDATIKVMDMQRGIRLTITPRDASNLSSLRDSLRRIETTGASGSQSGSTGSTTGGHSGSHGGSGSQGGSAGGGSSAGSTCALEGLSQFGAQVKVTEQAKSLRVDITSTSDVTRLRQHVRTMPQAGGSQGSSGSKQGGSGSQGSQGSQSGQSGKPTP